MKTVGILGRLSKKKGDVAIVLILAAVVALDMVSIYWVAYTTNPRLSYYKPPLPVYEGPRPELVDSLIVLVAGILTGIFLSDVSEMVYGYIAAMSIALVVSVVYVSLYIWYVLGWGQVFELGAFGWEWAVFFATDVIFTIMFPWIIGLCLIGLTVGAFLRTWIAWA